MTPLDDLMDRCRSQGVKLTPQRLAIFEYLAEHPGHPSAEEIYQDVGQRYPTLSFATVYNTLQLLVALGAAREFIVDELRRRYDLNTDPHQHAVCRRCHRIVDVRMDADRLLAEVDLSDYGFSLESASIEFRGLCRDCARDVPGAD